MRTELRLALCLAGSLPLLALTDTAYAQSRRTAPAPAVAEAAGQTARLELARKLIEISNIPEGVESWKRSISNPSSVGQCNCAREVQLRLGEAWMSAVAREFDSKQVVADLTEITAQQLSAADIKRNLDFRNSPVGLKISASEKAHQASTAGHPGVAKTKAEAAAKVLAADPGRARLVALIMKEIGGVRAYSDAMLNISLGAALGSSAAAPADRPRLSPQEIMAQIEKSRPAIERQMAPLILVSQGAMLAPLSNADLRAYAKELSTPAGRRLTAVTNAAFNASLRNQALKVGQRLIKEFNAEKI
jgi:hypothetical protein